MPNLQYEPVSTKSFDVHTSSAPSDDECLLQLARAIERHDDTKLDEVALLIGRLAVAIE